ncbi:hypothetical protein F441_21769 [Phytophthora nicotianae CJ01A1]|uniref:Uncharacterized protein n=1 Tax=Phytophthora nicotianae CJ01A1 TaxID=1317063 RepID=W2VRQ2_PHYNI|nr:hypothetical protein F441_21769 [Phytophthora nicotianae CJ01A1]
MGGFASSSCLWEQHPNVAQPLRNDAFRLARLFRVTSTSQDKPIADDSIKSDDEVEREIGSFVSTLPSARHLLTEEKTSPGRDIQNDESQATLDDCKYKDGKTRSFLVGDPEQPWTKT